MIPLPDILPKVWSSSTAIVLAVATIAILAMLGYTKAAITLSPQPEASAQPVEAAEGLHQVESITDGDSLRIVGIDRPIRIVGIDAPEATAVRFGHSECFGDHATAYLAALLGPAGAVEIELAEDPTDRYDRALGYVFLPDDGLFINEAMVREGMAYAVEYRPNTRYTDRLVAAENAARAEGLGIWGACPIEGHR